MFYALFTRSKSSVASVGSAVRNDILYYRAGSHTFILSIDLCPMSCATGMFGAIKGKATAVIGE